MHTASDGPYGSPRVLTELADGGRRLGRKGVARLMVPSGWSAAPSPMATHTIPDPRPRSPRTMIRRDFTTDPAAINTGWCGDITYIRTWEGWLYLATVIDIASVGWSASPPPSTGAPT